MTDPTSHHTTGLIDRIRELSRPLEPIDTDAPSRTPPMPEVRAVLWDVYGTMIISGSGDIGVLRANDNVGALQDALQQLGFDTAGDAPRAAARGIELVAHHVEAGHESRRAEGVEHPEIDIRTVWRRVLADLRAEGLIRGKRMEELLGRSSGQSDGESGGGGGPLIERFAVEYECRVNPVWPMPGIADVLRRLREAGRPLGIVSNAQFFTPRVIEALLDAPPGALGFRDDLCVYSYERLEAKPSTRLFEIALARLAETEGIGPERVLYIGNDMRNDIGPASTLGCRTALFAGDRRSYRPRADDPGCAEAQPDAVLHRLEELPAMLDGA